ncbi:MAG: hypothetical protein MUC95_08265 [Spirochaetes bacterium]|jgi:uncharacterized protein YcfL|nr:hypothetical protein [Spirochaetota bacterium]
MKIFRTICIVFIALFMIVSCRQSQNEITPELFIEIENKILSTDLTPGSKEVILETYGLTLKQYSAYEERLANDPELKTKVGAVRLKSAR